jgi:hypothetical protein
MDIFDESVDSYGLYRYKLNKEKLKNYDTIIIKEKSQPYKPNVNGTMYIEDREKEAIVRDIKMSIIKDNDNNYLVANDIIPDTETTMYRTSVEINRLLYDKEPFIVFNDFEIKGDNIIKTGTITFTSNNIILQTNGPTEEDKQNKKVNLKELKELIEESKITPIGSSPPFANASEDYLNAEENFYKKSKEQQKGGKSKKKIIKKRKTLKRKGKRRFRK